MRRFRPFLLGMLLVSAGCEAAAPAEQAPATGLAASPALAGSSTQGGRLALKDLAGAPAVLVFVRGSYCPLCIARLRSATAYAGAYQDAGVRLVAVTMDAPDVAKSTAHDLGLNYPLVSVDAATFQRWGVWPAGEPAPRPGDFVLDGEGRIRFSRVGADAADDPSDVALLGIVDSLRSAGALPRR